MLRHQHCLRAYGLEADDKHVYIAYEYVPGLTMRQAMRASRLGDEGAVEAAAQVLEGLAFAHARGIVHRDVKPANVLLAEGETISVRLADFGLAQLADADTLTAVGDVPGTLAYISPERLQGQTAGPPADVWAVGVLLWEALVGRHPFWRASPLETGEVIQAGARSIAEARPDLPPALVGAVDRALSVDPTVRPTAASLADALRTAIREREPRRKTVRLRLDPRSLVRRGAAPALAALVAAWTAVALPFFPARWPLLLALIAGALTAARARLGLAFTLAVPVFPLGNVSFGLALVYAGFAVLWLALMWRDPRRGMLWAVGPLLAPAGLLGLVPLVVTGAHGLLRRAAIVVAGVGVAGVVQGLRGSGLPFGLGDAAVLPVAGTEEPRAVLDAIWSWIEQTPTMAIEAAILAVTAAVLPYFSRRSDFTIATFGGVLLAATLLAAPDAAAFPLVATGWATCVFLAVQARRRSEIGARDEPESAVTRMRALCRQALSRIPGGTSRFPQTPSPGPRRLRQRGQAAAPPGGPRWPRGRPRPAHEFGRVNAR
jgi:hypothetical protein